MKRFIIACSIASLFFIAGCNSTPEKVAEKHLKDSIKSHSGLKIEKIEVEKLSEDKGKAVVNVKADIDYSQKLNLVKKDGKWVVE